MMLCGFFWENWMRASKRRSTESRPLELKIVLLITGTGFLATGVLAPILPLYLSGAGVSVRLIGLMLSIFTLAIFLSEFVWGWILDEISPKLVLVAGSLFQGLVIFSLFYDASIHFFFIVIFLYGFFWSPAQLISRWYMGVFAPVERKTASLALISLVISGGLGVGGFVGGWLANRFGMNAAILASAGINVGMGLILLPVLGRLKFDKFARDRSEEIIEGDELDSVPINFQHVVRLGVLSTIFSIAYSTLTTYLPLLSVEIFNSDAGRVGILFGVFGLVRFVMVMPIARLADRFGREWLVLVGLLGAAIAFGGFSLAPDYNWALVSVILFSLAVDSFVPAVSALISQGASKIQQGRIMGLFGAFEDGGAMIGPAVGGMLWGSGVRFPFLFSAGITGLGALFWLLAIYQMKTHPNSAD
jgi:MFS transporter, DHA1 family, multidrug resistance protein